MAATGSSTGPCASLKRRLSHRALPLRDAAPAPPAAPAGDSGVAWFFCAPPEAKKTNFLSEEISGHHFLDACFLCKLPLQRTQDIYMCRGNVPFCSEECRNEWIKERRCQRGTSCGTSHAASTWKSQKGTS